MIAHPVVTHEAWLTARKALLEKEKALAHARDELARTRRELPWELVEKQYEFDTTQGPQSLEALFDGRSQLIVYHFMFSPEWEVGCKSCSFWADCFNSVVPHIEQRDASFVAVSRAPLAKLQAFQKRLGWTFKWVSCGENQFNFDYDASFTEEQRARGTAIYNYAPLKMASSDLVAISVFCRDAVGRIFHTYSCYARGVDPFNTAYQYLDLLPKGRDEDELSYPMAWVKLRDQYETRR